jgi:hypothetical protein
VIAPPDEALCGADLTSTQLPGFTSLSAAELSSVTIVCGVKSTVAALRSRWVSWIALPDTDLTRPSMWSLPTGGGGGGGGGGLGAELGWLAAVPCCVEFWLFDEPHAAIDKAVTPASSGIINRVRDEPGKVTNIDASPIAGFTRARGYPLQRVYNTNGRGHRSALGGTPANLGGAMF